MKTWKIFLSVGIVAFVIGLAVLITGLALNGWKIGANLEMTTFTSEQDNNTLDLSLAAGELNVEYHDGENFTVDYPEAYLYRYSVTESNGVLKVEPASKRIYISWSGWLWGRNKPVVTVRIPRGKIVNLNIGVAAGIANVAAGEYGNVNIDLSAGQLYAGDIKCANFAASLSAGSAQFKGVECNVCEFELSAGNASVSALKSDKIDVDLSAGTANLAVTGNKAEYVIKVDKSAGSCNVSDQLISPDVTAIKYLNIDLSAGTVNVTFSG